MSSRNTSTARQQIAKKQGLKERAAQTRDAIGRFLKRGAGQVTDQPQPASLPEGSSAERRDASFSAGGASQHDAGRGHSDNLDRADAGHGRAPRQEHDMGRHETFENATAIADHLLAGTVVGRSAATAFPAPGSDEAKAAFKAACHEHTIRTQFANDYPELKRSPLEWWTADSLGKALATGELTPAECARLYPLATERELRMAQIEHELNLGALHALAFAESYPVAADDVNANAAEDINGADASLLQLGRQFQVARAREIEACEACNAAQREVDRHMPGRPACLTLRASDRPLNIYPRIMMAAALEGIQPTSADIEWLRGRMPMTHEVLRPIREGERAHIDFPGRKRDIVPHPEAQTRAEEIVSAWDAWRAERMRVDDEYLPDALAEAADEAGDETAALAEQIAALPARTADGFRVKLRALSHYTRNTLLSEIPADPDPDQSLAHSLWRDVKDDPADDGAPIASDQAKGEDPVFAAIKAARQAEDVARAFDESVQEAFTPEQRAQEGDLSAALSETMDVALSTVPTTHAGRLALVEFAEFRAQLYYGDNWQTAARHDVFGEIAQALSAAIRAERVEVSAHPDADLIALAGEFWDAYRANSHANAEIMAGRRTEAEWEPYDAAARALMDRLAAAEPKTVLGLALKCLAIGGSMAWELSTQDDPAQHDRNERIAAQLSDAALAGTLLSVVTLGVSPSAPALPDLVTLIDLASASLDDLQALQNTAALVGDVASAVCWQSRCHIRGWSEKDNSVDSFNAAGKLMHWLGDALTDVETAANQEAKRRQPTTPDDRATRLSMLAVSTINNGDPDETAAFAGELLAYAEAERAGR